MTHCNKSLMSVNVRLCGAIPRADMLTKPGAPCSLSVRLSKPSLAEDNRCGSEVSTLPTTTTTSLPATISSFDENISCDNDSNQMRGFMQTGRQPLGTILEPPSWAVPARGETRLEPVCEALDRQSAVDLTTKACFHVGRSPSSDIQLMHGTSSRRHAMLFHHSNGSCYIVDCGSAHGTYVNGRRIASSVNSDGVLIPHKVRRGALVRFGGPGAPCFVLKSFSFNLHEIRAMSEKTDLGELVRRNTRINALGKSAASTVSDSLPLGFMSHCKRSFDIISSAPTVDFDETSNNDDNTQEPCYKRIRCSSPPPSPEVPMRLVSPDLPCITGRKRRVHFSPDPPQISFPASVTPEVLSGDEGEM